MGRARRAAAGCLVATALAVSPALAIAANAAASAATPGQDLALALRFRPRLFFDAKERWRPIDADAFLAEAGHRVCPAHAGAAACAPLTSVAQLTPEIAYLDLRGTKIDGDDATAPDLATCARSTPSLLDCDEGGRSVLYAHVTHGLHRIAIDYWWFLRYNAFFPDDLEGDWEGVTVIVDAASTQVLDTHYAAHADVWSYAAGVGRVVDDHPIVYVARGTHASYPRPCRSHFCWQTGAKARHRLRPEGHADGAEPWLGNEAANCRRRCVRLLPVTASGAPASWNAWRGRWGKPRVPFKLLFQPPLTPAFQPRYAHPFAAEATLRFS